MPSLPDEVEALQALLTESRQARQALEAELRALKQRLASLERAPSHRPAATRAAGTQLAFALEHEGALGAAPAPAPTVDAAEHGAARALARERVILEPWAKDSAANCPSCSAPLEHTGLDRTGVLEYAHGAYQLIEYARPKAYCAGCKRTLQAPLPPRPIPRAFAGAGMLAHLLVSRYERNVSLYRQRQICAAAGITVDRTTLADWVEASWLLLEPLADALARHVLAGSHLHTASAAYPILAHGSGRTRIGRLWIYLRDERAWGSTIPPSAWFRFTSDRSGAQARTHLGSFSGTLQGPALDAEPIYRSRRIELLGCWAELRARIAQAHDPTSSGLIEELLLQLDGLYQIERVLFGRSPEARQALRLEHARPILDALHARLRECLRELPKKAELTAALRFALAHWKRLERYSSDGRAQMDGMDAQQLLQATVGEVGGRGTDTHGARAAGLYGLIATARLNGADPEQYLCSVLEHLSSQIPRNWETLLPWALSRDQY